MAVTQLVGAKIHRREDPRLITGHGHYIDDFVRQGTAYAAFARSPVAHARIKSIDVTDASKAPGIVGVYTARDFKGQLAGTHPAAPAFVAEKKYVPERFPIAEKEVTYQGEIVAVVLAETKGQAADAANMIQVDYDELPAVMDLEKALAKGSAKAHEAGPDNVCWDFTYTPLDLTEAAFKEADVVVNQRVLQNRLAPVPMEPRGVLAEYEGFDKKLTLWLSSQNPHFIRLFVSGALGLKESQVRVISPDVGGGFGSKISPYPEDYLVPALSRMTARPVKWIETRTESIQNATHGRRADQPRPHRSIPGRGPARGDPPRRADGRPRRARAEDGPGRHTQEELHPAGGLPVHAELRTGGRLGRLREGARQGTAARGLRRAAQEAGRPAQAGSLLRHRAVDVDRAVRLRPQRGHGAGHRRHRASGIGSGTRHADRRGHRLHGHALARAGPRDDVQPDRRRPAGRAAR